MACDGSVLASDATLGVDDSTNEDSNVAFKYINAVNATHATANGATDTNSREGIPEESQYGDQDSLSGDCVTHDVAGVSVCATESIEGIETGPTKKVSKMVNMFSKPLHVSCRKISSETGKNKMTVKLKSSIPVVNKEHEVVHNKNGNVFIYTPGNTNSLMKYKKQKVFSSRKALFEQLEKSSSPHKPVTRRRSLMEETSKEKTICVSVNNDAVLPENITVSSTSTRCSPMRISSLDSDDRTSYILPVVTNTSSSNLMSDNFANYSKSKLNSSKESSFDSDLDSIGSSGIHFDKRVSLRISSPDSEKDRSNPSPEVKKRVSSKFSYNKSRSRSKNSTKTRRNQLESQVSSSQKSNELSPAESTLVRSIKDELSEIDIDIKLDPTKSPVSVRKSSNNISDKRSSKTRQSVSHVSFSSRELSHTNSQTSNNESKSRRIGKNASSKSLLANLCDGEETFYKSSNEVKMVCKSASSKTGRDTTKSSLTKSRRSTKFSKNSELKTFGSGCESDVDCGSSVRSDDSRVSASSAASSHDSATINQSADDCDLNRLIDHLEKEHEELKGKKRSTESSPRTQSARPKNKKLPRVQKLISRFERK